MLNAAMIPDAEWQSANVIYYCDQDCRLVWFNKAFETFASSNGALDLGTSRLGTSLLTAFSGTHYSRLHAIYNQLFNGHLAKHTEHVICPSPDYRRVYQLFIVPVTLEGARYLRHETVPIPVQPAKQEKISRIQGEQLGGLEYYGLQQSLEHACGDAMWLQAIDGSRTVVLIADAMGHGDRAAGAVTELLKCLDDTTFEDLQQATVHTNQLYMQRNPGIPGDTPFVTGLLMVIDPLRAQLEAVSFGHDCLIFTPAGPVNVPNGLPIGICRDFDQWPVVTLNFNALGQRFMVYTDGIVEQFRPDGRAYGLDMLAQDFILYAHYPLAECVELIFNKVQHWRGSALVKDDQTLFGLQLRK